MAVRPLGPAVGMAGGELTMEIHGAITILTVITAVIAAWLS
jgi:hypothetical protein